MFTSKTLEILMSTISLKAERKFEQYTELAGLAV